MTVPINRGAWSPQSQRTSGHYDQYAVEYEGIRCHCRGCHISFVLSAQAQQVAYEVERRFVWWLPTLCPKCAAQLATLRIRDKEFQAQWNSSRQVLKNDRNFVLDWLAVIREISTLARFNSMQTHLERLL